MFNVLLQHFLFKDKSASIINTILDKLEMLTVEENTIVYKEGDKGDYFYIIKTGTFETSENKKQEKTILQSFDYFGE